MDIPNLWTLSPIGALIGLIVLIGVALIRGWFIPKSSHERELGLMKERGDEWRETSIYIGTVNDELLKQNRDLIESNRITDNFFRAMTGSKSGDGDEKK